MFYDPTYGRILVDGVDIRNVTLKSLRDNISPVLQDTFLFNGTIAENIGYADPAALLDEIITAAKAAIIHDSIMEMPHQYNTKVGERGMRLEDGRIVQSGTHKELVEHEGLYKRLNLAQNS